MVTKFITVVVVNSFLAVLSMMNLLRISAVWGVFLAFKYAKLWSEGYDWRDVFKQPRDRLFVDVAAETIDEARSIFDRDKRAEMRERARRRRELTAGSVAEGALSPAPDGALPASR